MPEASVTSAYTTVTISMGTSGSSPWQYPCLQYHFHVDAVTLAKIQVFMDNRPREWKVKRRYDFENGAMLAYVNSDPESIAFAMEAVLPDIRITLKELGLPPLYDRMSELWCHCYNRHDTGFKMEKHSDSRCILPSEQTDCSQGGCRLGDRSICDVSCYGDLVN